MNLSKPGSPPREGDLSGILVIDKPQGWTSHDVVARVRRLVGMKRVGHAGTLDPFATGVLVVAIGRATRLLQYVQHRDKTYIAHVVLGVETDSHDVDGTIVRRAEPERWPTPVEIQQVIRTQTGSIEQIPPMHSAIKIGGRRLYQRARAGEFVDLPARRVNVHQITVELYDPPDLHLAIWCGSGTYVRSIARDVGMALGTGAYCHALRRTRVGAFDIDQSWTLDALQEAFSGSDGPRWNDILIPPDRAVDAFPAATLDEAMSEAWYHGRSVDFPPSHEMAQGIVVRVYSAMGVFAGVGTVTEDHRLQPTLVFPVERGD